MRISIEGNIGSGKSTCVQAVSKLGYWGLVVQEPISAWEHWLRAVYEKGSCHFQLQVAVLLAYAGVSDNVVCERSPCAAMDVFVKQSLQDKTLSSDEGVLLSQVFDQVGWTPDVMIYLKTSPQICLARIKKRNRQGENAITLEYLQGLEEKHVAMCNDNAYIVDGNQSEREVVSDLIGVLNMIYHDEL